MRNFFRFFRPRVVTTGDGRGRRWVHLRLCGRYTPGLRIR